MVLNLHASNINALRTASSVVLVKIATSILVRLYYESSLFGVGLCSGSKGQFLLYKCKKDLGLPVFNGKFNTMRRFMRDDDFFQ